MARIYILDKIVAELIAAGEVVERPASIVKELVENSVDAGAHKIIVEIKSGGIGYIRITDDGSGIHNEDIPNAFLRHATSKVRNEKDLESISTLGFRGEALSSISSVSKVEITSKTTDSEDAWFYEIQGGSALEIPSPVGAPNGTTLIIKDVFYNTPARMKFLRSDLSEGNSVALVVDKCSLSYPNVAFEFIRDGKTKLKTSGNGDLRAVIASIYGKDFAKDMLEVNYNYENKIKVTGYIGSPSNSKPSRTYQNYFINGRYVKDRTCSVALEEAFKGKLTSGHFPVCVLNISVDFNEVDANVHPAKTEVRFSSEKSVYSAVFFAVKTTIQKTEVSVFENSEIETIDNKTKGYNAANIFEVKNVNMKRSKSNFDINIEVADDIANEKLIGNTKVKSDIIPIAEQIKPTEFFNFASKTLDQKSEKISGDFITKYTFKDNDVIQKGDEFSLIIKSDFKVIGELLETYILIQTHEGELVIVDKHAAHERILYEKLKTNIENGNRQILLSPVTLRMSRNEYSAVIENLSTFLEMGFLIEDFGIDSLIVRESPIELLDKDIDFIVTDIAGKIMDNKNDITPNMLEKSLYSIACKSAVRAGDKNSLPELEEIVNKLKVNPEITHCPHGRPVLVKLSKKEIEKMFGRLG